MCFVFLKCPNLKSQITQYTTNLPGLDFIERGIIVVLLEYTLKDPFKNTPLPTWCTRDQLKFHWILLSKTKDLCHTFENASENIHLLLISRLQLKLEIKRRGAFVCLFLSLHRVLTVFVCLF